MSSKLQNQPETPAGARPLRILLVEDHRETLSIIAKLLRHYQYEVAAADCSKAARKMLGTEAFDILLTDIALPDGDGHALLQQAKKSQPKIRGIALTGFGSEQDLRSSEAAGFDFHLTKPVDFHELRTILNRI